MADSHTLGLSQVGSRPAGEPRRTAGISGSLWASRGAAVSSCGTHSKQELQLWLAIIAKCGENTSVLLGPLQLDIDLNLAPRPTLWYSPLYLLSLKLVLAMNTLTPKGQARVNGTCSVTCPLAPRTVIRERKLDIEPILRTSLRIIVP